MCVCGLFVMLRSQVQRGRVAWPPGAAVRWTRGPSRLTPVSRCLSLSVSLSLSFSCWVVKKGASWALIFSFFALLLRRSLSLSFSLSPSVSLYLFWGVKHGTFWTLIFYLFDLLRSFSFSLSLSLYIFVFLGGFNWRSSILSFCVSFHVLVYLLWTALSGAARPRCLAPGRSSPVDTRAQQAHPHLFAVARARSLRVSLSCGVVKKACPGHCHFRFCVRFSCSPVFPSLPVSLVYGVWCVSSVCVECVV